MMCGATMSVASVAVPVNRVKKIRHNLSITIAANFQSDTVSSSSSFSRVLLVRYLRCTVR